MNIRLYNISDNPNKVKKSASKSGGTLIEDVRFKDADSLNVLNPTLLLNINSDISECIKFNYVYIPKTTRFYYITNISTVGGLIAIDCKVDVLMSWCNDILESQQYVSRTETDINGNTNGRLVDNLLPIHSDHLINIEPFGNSVYDENCIYCILETAGKGGTV